MTKRAILFLASMLMALAADNAAPVRVLVSNGMKGALEELQAPAERAIGHALSIDYSSTAALKKRIESGEEFDATVITDEAIADLVKQSKLTLQKALSKSELGIGIKTGVAKPDIHSVDALKKSLQSAKSITYPQDGASRGFIDMMFDKMGIAAEVEPKIILAPGSGPATQSVADGKASMVITLFSEIVPIKGVDILGALPGEYQ